MPVNRAVLACCVVSLAAVLAFFGAQWWHFGMRPPWVTLVGLLVLLGWAAVMAYRAAPVILPRWMGNVIWMMSAVELLGVVGLALAAALHRH